MRLDKKLGPLARHNLMGKGVDKMFKDNGIETVM